MNSLTSFAFTEYHHEDKSLSIEFKSINHRFLEIDCFLPPTLSFLEQKLTNLIKKDIKRGKIKIIINFKESSLNLTENIDFNSIHQFKTIFARVIDDLSLNDEVKLFHLLRINDLFKVERNYNTPENIEYITDCFVKVLDDFIENRKLEGKALQNDIFTYLQTIKTNVEKIKKLIPDMEKKLEEDLFQRIKKFVNDGYDEVRILTEVGILVNKTTIAEEVCRLETHIQNFNKKMKEKSEIGKSLDFICQEMNREINTIGSKVVLIDIINYVIETKNAIEKIREQLRNVE